MIKITLKENVKTLLDGIKSTKGVENVVLTQRDGNPIQYSGIWFSKDEIFNVSASTSAIYNCALQLYQDQLKYVLIEGKRGKIIISPLKNYGSSTLNKIIDAQNLQGNDNNFFIAITARPSINLGGILLKIRKQLIEIKKELILSGETFKPPLKHYNQQNIDDLLNVLNVREDTEHNESIDLFSTNISHRSYQDLQNILRSFNNQTVNLLNTYITLSGGFTVANLSNEQESLYNIDREATLSYSLFSTATKTAWLLKNMHLDSILIECVNSFQFINKANRGIFSAKLSKGSQKLGLLRLLIPRYSQKINEIIEIENQRENKLSNGFKKMFMELTL